ncbi:MAG: hypothetical protein R3E48_09520 [Burkholderiaceae bacterium]
MREALAITHLLKSHNAPLNAAQANRLLLRLGILEEAERESSAKPGAVRRFKKLSQAGEAWGLNEWNAYGDAQPKFYVDSFPNLLERLLVAAGVRD